MVDVGGKDVSQRRALARGSIQMSAEALLAVRDGSEKGDVFQVARIAGIQAAKRTADLIPLCHPVPLDSVRVELALDESNSAVVVEATVTCSGRTGVEMEALTAVTVALLTIYDMAKAVDRAMQIGPIQLAEKSGGRSGDWTSGLRDGRG
tara:strand:- start:501 stop:950 length:450 start_codon:yes stop_codon:yes gene_type:complete